MLCPRCGQENPDHGQFCTQCGLPLTENAARAAASMTKNNGHSKGGRAFGAFCKAICYVLLFIILQSSVLGIYGGFVASSHMTDMFLGGSFTEQDMMQLMERLGVQLPAMDHLSGEGKTPLHFACQDGTYLGTVAAADMLKEDAAEAIAGLKKLGLELPA